MTLGVHRDGEPPLLARDGALRGRPRVGREGRKAVTHELEHLDELPLEIGRARRRRVQSLHLIRIVVIPKDCLHRLRRK